MPTRIWVPQTVLLLAALVAVPWMLLPKPFLLKARFEKQKYAIVKNNSDLELPHPDDVGDDTGHVSTSPQIATWTRRGMP